MSARTSRLTIALAAAVALSAGWPSVASADQTIQVTPSPLSPIDGASTTLTVAGSSDTGGSVYVSFDAAGATCGSNPSNDAGNLVTSGDNLDGPAYADTYTLTPTGGSYVVCAWLMPLGDDGSGAPLAGPASTPLTVQPLRATVTLSAPVSVAYQQPIPVRIDWQADATGALFVSTLPSSYGPCTATPESEPQFFGWLSGQNGYTNNDPIGQAAAAGTNRYLAGEFAAGSYRVCAWIEEPSGSVVAGPVSLDVQMLALPGSRTYSGRTSQHLPLAIAVTGYSVQDIIYSARFSCRLPEYFATGLRWNGVWTDRVLTAANFGTLRLVAGHFTSKLDANPANRFDIRGAAADDSVTGTFSAVMRVGPPQFKYPETCRTGPVRFRLSTHLRRQR
jgi:hypothetical protein